MRFSLRSTSTGSWAQGTTIAQLHWCYVRLNRGDCFLLYTDGVVETENSAGQ